MPKNPTSYLGINPRIRGQEFLAPEQEFSLSVPAVGEQYVPMPDQYIPKNIAPPVNIQEPTINQNFPQIDAYQQQLMQSPALAPDQYKPSVLRRIAAGAIGFGAGYNYGPKAGFEVSEGIIDTPYRRALQRYNESLLPYAAGAKQEMDKYKSDIDFYGKSSEARKRSEDIERDREKSAREETNLSLTSSNAQANVGRLRAYEKQVAGSNRNVIQGYPPEGGDYQFFSADKLSNVAAPLGVMGVDPMKIQELRNKGGRERAQIIASTFNVTPQQVRIADMGATEKILAKKPEYSRFFDKKSGQPIPPTEQSGPEWLEYQKALSMWDEESRNIIQTTKPKVTPSRKFIGDYEVISETP